MTNFTKTNTFGLRAAQDFVDDATETRTYLFASQPPATDNVTNLSVSYMTDLYENMIFGKRMDANSVSIMVRNIPWVSGTTYSQYDSTDMYLYTRNYYAIVDEGEYYHVYKCLYNSGGAKSTVEPDFSMVTPEETFFQLSDGYIWKYMTSVPEALVDKFSTSDWFPIVANTDVSDAAVDGSIDVVEIVSRGRGYDNYLSGVNTFGAGQLRLGGNTRLYDISSNSSASVVNDFYTGCYIYIKSGTAGEVGQYRRIIDYQVNATSKAIVVQTPFNNVITTAAAFEIYPGVNFVGQNQTVNAEAMAIINSYGNTVESVFMLNEGAGYQEAVASMQSSNVVSGNGAVLQVMYGPPGGHGFDQFEELGANVVGMALTFSNTEGNTIPDTNFYTTIGLLSDPLWQRVVVGSNSINGNFLGGEVALKVRPTLVGSNATLSAGNTTVTGGIAFDNQFVPGDRVYFGPDFDPTTANSTFFAQGNGIFVANVASVTNSSYMTIDVEAPYGADASVSYYYPNVTGRGTVNGTSLTSMTLTSANCDLATGDVLVGESTGSTLVVSNVTISGQSKTVATFNNAYKYRGTVVSGTFLENEVVYQDTLNTANAVMYAYWNGSFLLTNVNGNFDLQKNIEGQTSGAIGRITEVYPPDLTWRSGDITYVEYIGDVQRTTGQTETFKIILKF
jgi:hypothetical protein